MKLPPEELKLHIVSKWTFVFCVENPLFNMLFPNCDTIIIRVQYLTYTNLIDIMNIADISNYIRMLFSTWLLTFLYLPSGILFQVPP